MTMKLLLRKIRLEGEEFLTSDVLRKYCRSFKLDYGSTAKYLISRGYLVRIFRGIFYVKSLDELRLGGLKYSHLELVSKGLELKGVENWYFGLYTALKLNNLTHEHYTVDYVVNDKIFRARPIRIAGYRFRFLKLKPALFGFGIVEDGLRYSDPEKTILDFIYVWRYNGVPEERIIVDVSEYSKSLSKEKLMDYAGRYPKTVGRIIGEVFG
jgi:predicted transcriptional regulator of viral defense system